MPVTIPKNEEAAQRARELYVPGVFGYKRVAEELGVSTTTAKRYIDPDYHERMRVQSLEAKRRRRGICERCGGETRYNDRTTNGPSSLCHDCANKPWTHCANGHELTPDVDLRPSRKKSGWTCRICRNDYMREWSRQRRRAEGKPERDLAVYESRRLKLEKEEAPE